jgi:hypothetical protein
VCIAIGFRFPDLRFSLPRPRHKGLESILLVGVYYYRPSILDFAPHPPPAEAQRVGVHIGC